jgi:hypothetical protein
MDSLPDDVVLLVYEHLHKMLFKDVLDVIRRYVPKELPLEVYDKTNTPRLGNETRYRLFRYQECFVLRNTDIEHLFLMYALNTRDILL